MCISTFEGVNEMNLCIFSGRLTREVESRYIPNGSQVSSFSLAINKRWKDKDGQTKESVTFAEFELWGDRGKILQSLQKGSRLTVQAEYIQQEWTDAKGEKRRSHKFRVENFEIIDYNTVESKPANNNTEKASEEEEEDDIPF